MSDRNTILLEMMAVSQSQRSPSFSIAHYNLNDVPLAYGSFGLIALLRYITRLQEWVIAHNGNVVMTNETVKPEEVEGFLRSYISTYNIKFI